MNFNDVYFAEETEAHSFTLPKDFTYNNGGYIHSHICVS